MTNMNIFHAISRKLDYSKMFSFMFIFIIQVIQVNDCLTDGYIGALETENGKTTQLEVGVDGAGSNRKVLAVRDCQFIS